MLLDIHQHIWTESLLDALAVRDELPFVRRDHGLTVLHSVDERPYVIDTDAESASRRLTLLRRDGLDAAVVALSSPIGIEALPGNQARELIAAHLDGVRALPDEFGAWGPVALESADPADVDRVVNGGCVGVSLPAAALAGPDALDLVDPILGRTAALGAPLFVHPGPAPATRRGDVSLGEPLWWRPLTDYVAQMQAAWLSFAALGRRRHPELEVIFAMLAGGAPLLSERLAARGGPQVDVRDPLVYYETSSYGPTAVEAMARRVGPDQLLYGSDRPVIEPHPTGREAILRANGARVVQSAGSMA
jgi:predicted TIM-barrel fold metal-dependent hydrolase